MTIKSAEDIQVWQEKVEVIIAYEADTIEAAEKDVKRIQGLITSAFKVMDDAEVLLDDKEFIERIRNMVAVFEVALVPGEVQQKKEQPETIGYR